jgi:LPS-assembly protein
MTRHFLALCLFVAHLALPVPTLAEGKPLDFAADELTYDQNAETVTASGNVVMAYDGMLVHADQVIYNRNTGKVAVAGEIWAELSDGSIIRGQDLVIDERFENGVISNIGVILADNSRFAAAQGTLQGRNKTTLSRAVYSPCEVCGEDDVPLWQVKAVRVVHDRGKKRVTYKSAWIEAFGVPVVYTPYFSHPDPTVHAASGFLAPDLGQSRALGLIMEIPYYWRIADNKDATITPIITTRESIVLSGEYRQHFGPGQMATSGSITNVDKRDEFGNSLGRNEYRGHIFSRGKFEMGDPLGVGGDWQWRYDVGWTSDDTYLRRYRFSDMDTVVSEAAIERFGKRSYGAITAVGFQGLRVEDVSGLTPFVLPMAEYYYRSPPGFFGGSFEFNANALAITRLDGLDTRRLSTAGRWEVPFITEAGNIFTVGLSLRGDFYYVSDSANPDEAAYAGRDGTSYRVLPQARLEWRRPMIRTGENTQQTLEPIMALVGGFNSGNPDEIPNEDSRIAGFDDTNLFADSRFTGLDRWEAGSRIDYGIRYGVDGNSFSVRTLVGQSYRFYKDPEIPDGTGLEGHFSDIVARVEATLSPYLDIIYRARIDNKDGKLRRNEVDAIMGPESFRVTLGYLDLKSGADEMDPTAPLLPREEVRGAVAYKFSRYWQAIGSYIYDIGRDASVAARGGIIYEDECLRFGIVLDRRFTSDRDIRPDTSVILKIALKNLG